MPQFENAVIGYEFQFTITENNNNSGSASFRLPFTDGNFTLGLSAGNDLQRHSDRNFKFAETFEEVIGADCRDDEPVKRWKYPITGNIGLKEVVETFVRLETLTNLDESSSTTVRDKSKKLATFADKLLFTTTFRGSVEPAVELDPGPLNSFRLARASGSFGADRSDVHRVTVALALDLPAEGRPPLGLVPESALIDPRPRGLESARDRVLYELDRQRLLENDERILELLQ
jgi:hypothetical protein